MYVGKKSGFGSIYASASYSSTGDSWRSPMADSNHGLYTNGTWSCRTNFNTSRLSIPRSHMQMVQGISRRMDPENHHDNGRQKTLGRKLFL